MGLLFIAFAASRLGVFGVTSYNIFRLLFGSLAYLLLVGAFIYLLIPKVLREREGTISGFWLIVIGLLIEFQAYLDWTYQGSDLFGHTLKLALSDLAKFQVTAFLGGGMIGSIFYLPVSFLFANVGSFFIGLLVIAFGIFFVSPWSVYDVADGLAVAKDKLVETQVKRAELRTQKKAEREEKRQQELARLEEERLRLEEEEESARALALVDRHVNLETGEILEEEPVQVPIISEYDHLDIEDEFPIMLAEDDQPAQSNSASQDSGNK